MNRREEIRKCSNIMLDYVSQIVRQPADTIDPRRHLHELGLTSAQMVRMLGVLEESFDIEIPETIVFESTTVDGISVRVVDQHLSDPNGKQ